MIILLAPSKTMDYTEPINSPKTEPAFVKQASQITEAIRNEKDFQAIANISDKLTAETLAKFEQWGSGPKQRAMRAYCGDVYNGLNTRSWNLQDGEFAQKHLRILSGLYGYVRPYDLIESYRLEMKTNLKIAGHKNLYYFWGSAIADELLKDTPKFILNATSDEYLRAVKKYLPKSLPIITPKFVEEKNGKLKDVTIFTKVMRGIFASWVVKSKITESADLKSFNFGYSFAPELSDKLNLVFIKKT